MIILDTNVVSEPTKEQPNPSVLRWLESLPRQAAFITSITAMELSAGVERMPTGKRKDNFTKQNRFLIDEVYKDRILAFDLVAAELCGVLIAENWSAGHNVKLPDTQIAAIALSRGFTLATRNMADFQFERMKLINPWAD